MLQINNKGVKTAAVAAGIDALKKKMFGTSAPNITQPTALSPFLTRTHTAEALREH